MGFIGLGHRSRGRFINPCKPMKPYGDDRTGDRMRGEEGYS